MLNSSPGFLIFTDGFDVRRAVVLQPLADGGLLFLDSTRPLAPHHDGVDRRGPFGPRPSGRRAARDGDRAEVAAIGGRRFSRRKQKRYVQTDRSAGRKSWLFHRLAPFPGSS